MPYRGKFTFYHWLGVSLALHVCVILPFIVTTFHAPYQDKPNKLLIELFGMVSNRQVEEKKKGTEGARQNRVASRQSVARQQVKKAAPKQSPDKPETAAPDAPVHVEKTDDSPGPAEQATAASLASLPSVATSAGGSVEQRQQSIRHADEDAVKAREYGARLSKRLQANLVYPEEVRKHGIEGVSTIAFTIMESGDIKRNSLRVQKSSGYAALDSNALKSALASAPFEKPPKEVTISIAVSFVVDAARTRTNRATLLLHRP